MTDLLTLSSGAVDLWLATIGAEDPPETGVWRRLLSDDERARNDRFIAPSARRQHLAARALLRMTLSRYAPSAPNEWRFAAGVHGKPMLAAPAAGRDLRFNLSHTDGLVAIVVAEGREVGVDVENVTRPIDVGSLGKSVFSHPERLAFGAASPSAQPGLFFTLWTLKEAYAKALGIGLSRPFAEVAFDLSGEEPRLAFDGWGRDGDDWRFASVPPTARHALAVAAEGGALDLRVFWRGADGC